MFYYIAYFCELFKRCHIIKIKTEQLPVKIVKNKRGNDPFIYGLDAFANFAAWMTPMSVPWQFVQYFDLDR